MDIEQEIIEIKSMQGQILQIIKDTQNEIRETQKETKNMRSILIGNGKPEESFVFRLKHLEDAEKNCPITLITNKLGIILITAIASGVIGLINIFWTSIQKIFIRG